MKILSLRAEAANVFQAVDHSVLYQKLQLSMIWKEIRTHEDKVDWCRVVWSPLYIPRHSFFSWLVLLDRNQLKID